MNIFDNLQNNLFDTVTNTMGYDATWTPSTPANTPEKTAKVLYKGPSEKHRLVDADFNPDKIVMEYKQGDFDGLKALADDNTFETVNIDTMGEFLVKSVEKIFDGKTLIAYLTPKENAI